MTACQVCKHFYPSEYDPAMGTAMPGTCRLQLPPWLRPGPDAEPDRWVDGHDHCDLGTPLHDPWRGPIARSPGNHA